MSAVTSEAAIAARLIPALKALGKPVSCVELSRAIIADSSAIFRILSKHPQVSATKSKELTTFLWVG